MMATRVLVMATVRVIACAYARAYGKAGAAPCGCGARGGVRALVCVAAVFVAGLRVVDVVRVMTIMMLAMLVMVHREAPSPWVPSLDGMVCRCSLWRAGRSLHVALHNGRTLVRW